MGNKLCLTMNSLRNGTMRYSNIMMKKSINKYGSLHKQYNDARFMYCGNQITLINTVIWTARNK